MAFAAVTSALAALLELVVSPRISNPSSTLQDESSESENFETQWDLLINTLQCCSEVVTASDEGIMIEEARRLQDAIEFAVSLQFLEQSKCCKPTFSLKLDHLEQDVVGFTKAAEKTRRRIEELWDQKVRKTIEEDIMEICVPRKEGEEEDEDVSESVADMVGLNDEFHRVRDEITRPLGWYRRFYYLDKIVFRISGMAGIGKTTFAKRLYHDPLVKKTFECRAFVRVGREYRVERVLRAITAQLSRGDEEMMMAGDNQDLPESFCTILGAKRCLIVLDDVWDKSITENLVQGVSTDKIDCWGSLILLTSRMAPQAYFRRVDLKIRFLNEEESWELLRRKVFGEEEVCPPLLVKAGKKIAKKCGGLPLLINAVAPILLSEADHDPKLWNRVAEKPNSVLEEASNQIYEVLISSYNDLPETYKSFFLYISAFPHTDPVFCSTIMKLWYAEGFFIFLDKDIWAKDKSLAFQFLLLSNLVISDQERTWVGEGKIKTCSLHCAYWYMCKRVAKEKRFLYIMNSYADGTDERVKCQHRLAIQTNVLLAIKEVGDMIASIPTMRSLLCTGPYHQYQVPAVRSEWKLLRVLDAVTIRFYEFPVEVVNLILLKYLALTCNANLPPSISKLWRLQFLIVHQHLRIRRVAVDDHQSYYVPVEIWELQELIHLEIPGRNLPHPPHPGVVFPNLEKVLDVGVESCTKGVLDNIPNLKKLRIQTELVPDAAETLICFYNIESFQYVVMNPTLLPPPPLPLDDSIPFYGLEKLSLSGCGYPWEEMSKIGKLKWLKVLKLRCYAFRGEKWETNEETDFNRLVYLYIEDTDLVQWSATMTLRRLTLKNCHKLHEIPTSLHLQNLKIELIDCNPLAETWAKQYYDSDTVTATYSWKHKSTSLSCET